MTERKANNESSSVTPLSDGLLLLDGVSASYGATAVLRNVSVTVPEGQSVALLGANGAGKTTLLRVASGLLRPTSGKVWLGGRDVTSQPAFRRVRDGLCLVPEGRGIFPSLTVRENLELQIPSWIKHGAPARALEVFPALISRMEQEAGTLSGGEQQMLALARAVLAQPRVILLDEISTGLAPLVVGEMFNALKELAARGIAMLLVEQYIHRALEMCSLVYVINKGEIVYSGPPGALVHDTLIQSYLAGSNVQL